MNLLLLLMVISGTMVLAVEGWVLVHLLGQNGRMLLRLDALEEQLNAAGRPSTVGQRGGSTIPRAGAATRPATHASSAPLAQRSAKLDTAAHGHPRNGESPAPVKPVGPQIGETAPPIQLEDLTGKVVNLDDFRGRETLVAFWNPGCGFCKRMLEDLRAWESDPPEGAPQLLVLSTGTVEATQAMGLRSPVVLDRGLVVGRSFGATGTPSAVLVDAQGCIASRLARGGPAVLALANLDRSPAASVAI